MVWTSESQRQKSLVHFLPNTKRFEGECFLEKTGNRFQEMLQQNMCIVNGSWSREIYLLAFAFCKQTSSKNWAHCPLDNSEPPCDPSTGFYVYPGFLIRFSSFLMHLSLSFSRFLLTFRSNDFCSVGSFLQIIPTNIHIIHLQCL